MPVLSWASTLAQAVIVKVRTRTYYPWAKKTTVDPSGIHVLTPYISYHAPGTCACTPHRTQHVSCYRNNYDTASPPRGSCPQRPLSDKTRPHDTIYVWPQ